MRYPEVRFVLLVGVATVGLLTVGSVGVLAQDAGSVGVTGCTTIESPGSYVVQNVIDAGEENIRPNETCISVNSSDVTVDGQGYSMVGVGSQNSTGIGADAGFGSFTNVTVKDVRLLDWGTGISFTSVNRSRITDLYVENSVNASVSLTRSSDNLIEDNRLTESRNGISLSGLISVSSSNLVRNNTVTANEESGVSLALGAEDNVVRNNSIRDNNGSGVVDFFATDNNTVVRNGLVNNTAGVATVFAGNTSISDNDVSRSEIGVLSAYSYGVSVDENEVSDSHLGILLQHEEAPGAVVSDNGLRNNSRDFLDVVSAQNGTTSPSLEGAGGVLEEGTEGAEAPVRVDVEGYGDLAASLRTSSSTVRRMSIGPEGNDTVVSFEPRNVSVDGVGPAEAPSPPSGYESLGLYFNATGNASEVRQSLGGRIDNTTISELTGSYLDVQVMYNDTFEPLKEETVSLWRYDATESNWEKAGSTVEMDEDVVAANLTEFSTFGVFVRDIEVVSDAQDLQSIRNDLDEDYILSGDVGSSSIDSFEPIGGCSPSSPDGGFVTDCTGEGFTGSLDGRGHNITGLSVDRPKENSTGLFGYIGPNGSVEDLSLSVDVSGKHWTGGLADVSEGTVSDVSVTGAVSGGRGVGGAVGVSYGGSVLRSVADVNVTGSDSVGGLVGTEGFFGTVRGSSSKGNVTGTGERVGGVVGTVASGSVKESYATGPVQGEKEVGGVVGGLLEGSVSASYSVGEVSGGRAGGIVGRLGNLTSRGSGEASITDSYWDNVSTNRSDGVGREVSGEVNTTIEGTQGLTTERMTGGSARDSMDRLDFGGTWAVNPNGYPIFARNVFTEPMVGVFTEPPRNTGELHPTLYEDLNGDGGGKSVA